MLLIPMRLDAFLTFRLRNPTETQHTCISMTQQGKCFSRLDYMYVTQDLVEEVTYTKTCYDTKVFSDHIPIWLALNTNSERCNADNLTLKMNTTKASPKQWNAWGVEVEERLSLQTPQIDRLLSTARAEDTEAAIDMFNDTLVGTARKLFRTSPDQNETAFSLALRDDRLLHQLKARATQLRTMDRTEIDFDPTPLKEVNKEIKKRRKLIL